MASNSVPFSPQYQIIGADGSTIAFTKEAFEAIQYMMRSKLSGSVILDFKNGGIAGVEMSIKKVYK